MSEQSTTVLLSPLQPLPTDRKCIRCHGSRLFQLPQHDGIEVWQCSGGGCDQKYQRPITQRLAAPPSKTVKRPRPDSAEGQPVSLGAIKDEHAPLTINDRIQAVLRSAAFRGEAQAFLSKIEQEMHVLSPEEKPSHLIHYFTNNEIARKWNVPPEVVLGAGALALSGQPYNHSDRNKRHPLPDGHARRMMVRDIRNARYLTLEIDLTLPEAESLKHARSEIVHYQALLGLELKRRNKPTQVDPWLVHDLKHEGKLNLLQVTHRLFKCSGRPADDDQVNQSYQRVQRAYRNAAAMIKFVSRSKPS